MMQLQAVLELIDRTTAPLRNMTNQSRATTDALNQNREQLRQLQRTSANINSFRSLNQSLQQTGTELAQAQAQAQQLARAYRATANPTRAMTREFEQARERVRQLQQAQRDQTSQLQNLRQSLNGAGVDTRDLANQQRRLDDSIRTTTDRIRQQNDQLQRQAQHSRRLQDLQNQRRETMERFDENMGYGGTMLGVGAGLSIAAGLPVLEFSKAEDAATSLKVSMMGVGGKVPQEFQQINDLANQLGNKLPGTTAEFQTMMAKLVQQGISYKAILGGVGEASAYLGVQLKMPFDEAAEFAAKMQDATKTAEGDMLGLMDTIQKSFYLGVDPTNMLGGFSAISDGMKTIKQSGLEGAKAMAPLLVMADQASMQGSTAGIAFSKIFSKMMDTKNIKKSLKGTGISMDFTDGKGEFGGLDKMYKQLEQLKSLSTEARKPIFKAMFGDDAETTKALNLLIDKGKSGYEETIAKMEAQADLQTRVNEQLGTLKNLWDAAAGTFSNAMVALGEAIAPEVKALVTWITDLAEGLQNWAKENPRTANVILKLVAGFGALFLVLGALTILITSLLLPFALLRFTLMSFGLRAIGIIGLLGRALSWLSMTIRLVAFTLAANPLLAALLLLAVAAYMIYKNWGPIKEFFINLWNSIVSYASAGIEAVVNFFSSGMSRASAFVTNGIATIVGFFSGLYSQFTTAGGQIVQGLIDGLTAKWEGLKAKAASIADSITGTVKGVLGIHSPSRVFHELGMYTMQGMQGGLLANAGLPINTMSTTSQGLIKALDTSQIQLDKRPPLGVASAAGGASGSAAPVTINITINAAAGMNEQQLAQQVALQVQAAMQKQTTNGALYDQF